MQKNGINLLVALVVVFVCSGVDLRRASAVPVFEFSVDIGSDTELSDPNADGNEGFDPGDVYLWKSSAVPPGGRDGIKDDAVFFAADPRPDPPDAAMPPATAVPVGTGDIEEYLSFLDLDGHDQVDVLLAELIPSGRLETPIPFFDLQGIYPARHLALSYDDDGAIGWPHGDVPVSALSPAGQIYGHVIDFDEIVSVELNTTSLPFTVTSVSGVADEQEVHLSLSPNPGLTAGREDDDVDSLDIIDDGLRTPSWLMSVDHEGALTLDPGDIYEVMPGTGLLSVIDDVIHLGLPDTTDIDAFELVWLTYPKVGRPVLALLFSVDDDDPLTRTDESGGLDPRMIYASFLTGTYFDLLEEPLSDDIDGLTNWSEQITADFPLDWGDAPQFVGAPGYPVQAVRNGASHRIGGPWLGDATDMPDGDVDGQPDLAAAGDDTDGNDDENGVMLPIFMQGRSSDITVEVSGGGVVQAWIDFNGDSVWQHPAEEIFAGFLPAGTHTLTVPMPIEARVGQTYARFRISTTGGLSPMGGATDGEVEDYVLTIEEYGFTETDHFPDFTAQLDVNIDSIGGHVVSVNGPAIYEIYFDSSVEGSAVDNNGNGRDDVETKFTQMDLSGWSPLFGQVIVRLNPAVQSLGGIEELVNNTPGTLDVPPFVSAGSAYSFFDIFLEIDLPNLGWTLHTLDPMRIEAIIDHKPPQSGSDAYVWCPLGGAINLYRYGYAEPVGFIDCSTMQPAPVIEIDDFEVTAAEFKLITPSGTERLFVTGPARQHVYFEGAVEGTADDDDSNGRDEVQTELVSLNLTGTSPMFGPVAVRLRSGQPASGAIEETTNITSGVLDVPPFVAPGTTAESFFDVFYEIDVNGWLLYTESPMHVSGIINSKPPGPGDELSWCNAAQPIELLDATTGDPTGIFLDCLSLQPDPVVEIDVFSTSRGTFELITPLGINEQLQADGSAVQHVYFEGPVEGTADDDTSDGLDEVHVELIALDLTGSSPTMGPVAVHLHPELSSTGVIQETVNLITGLLEVPPFVPPGSNADSFFDVFVEVDIGGQPLRSQVPMRVSGTISHKPPVPGDVLQWCSPPFPPIELFDTSGEQSGYSLLCTSIWLNAPPPCVGDFDSEGDVDGVDASILANNLTLMPLSAFAGEFGRTDCH